MTDFNVGDRVTDLSGADLGVGTIIGRDWGMWAVQFDTFEYGDGSEDRENALREGEYHTRVTSKLIKCNTAGGFLKGSGDLLAGERRTYYLPKSPDKPSNFEQNARRILDALGDELVAKNVAYGNSALDPVRIFSKSDRIEQLYVRLDDKLSRLARGGEYPGDDTLKDIHGYITLILMAKESE